MAEQRFERDLRAMLVADLDPVQGPHPRWADAPAARRVAGRRVAPARWRSVAILAAALVGVLVLALALAVMPSETPVASAPPATVEPWPSTIGPSATPTSGEIALGRVAVATAFGEPALLVRVSPGTTQALDAIGITIEARVVGPLDRAIGVDRFIVVRGGRAEAPGLGVTGADPLAIPVDAPVGTQVSATFSIPAGPDENVDLGYAGSGTSVTFRYPVHRAPAPPSLEGRCPTLEDYAVASLQPSPEPARPSFDPVAPDATPSTGFVAIGDTGVIPAPDGSPGALVRVSNVRFCDRLPDYRPDQLWSGRPVQLLLADVEIVSLQTGALAQGFIPGRAIVVASYGGRFALDTARPPLHMPGHDPRTTLDTGPGFGYRGTMVWEAPSTDVRITIDAVLPGGDANGMPPVQLSYLAREGTDYTFAPATPAPTSGPAAPPTTGTARVGESVVLEADGGTVPLVVDGIAEVPRYPGVAPSPPAAGFVEVRLDFGPGSGTFSFDPAEWVVVGPDGASMPELEFPRQGTGYEIPPGWPNVASSVDVVKIPPDWPGMPLWVVAEVPAEGRITLEYRPDGGPALVTWVLRDE